MKSYTLMFVSMFLFLFGMTVCSAAPAGEYLAENNSSGGWIPWNDPTSDGGRIITTSELQEIIYYWINGLVTPEPELAENFTNSIGMEFVKIPAGEFMMGSPTDEEGRFDDEGPVHKITIEEPFYLGKYEVTQEQWFQVMKTNPSNVEGNKLPVESVSWDDIQVFIKKLNEKEGTDKYRLPSEAEWEYACRANTTTRHYFGDDESKLGDYVWYRDNSDCKTHAVGQKKPNPWGLYDMYGNVCEWCQDRWHDDYDGAPSDGRVWKNGSSSLRVYRGGSWDYYARYCRSAIRYRYDPGSRRDFLGFRVLRKL